MSYIKKHWNGEYSLAVSFWVNLVLLGFALRFIDVLIAQASFLTDPVSQARAWIGYAFISLVVIYPWQVIGVWRSAENHVERTKKKGWATAAKVMLSLGVLSTFANVSQSWPTYQSMYDLAFVKSEYSEYKIELVGDGTILHLSGGLGFGVASDVKEMIEDNPNIEGIILDSIGGRIIEGRKLSQIVLDNELDTYSIEGCYSACGTVFVSGKERYLARGANLGFHQYNAGEFEGSIPIDMATEQEFDLAIYRQKGISESFLKRLFRTDKDDMWYPTIPELMEAGVVHGVVEPSTLNPVVYTSAGESDIAKVVDEIPGFSVIKKYEPELYGKLIDEMKRSFDSGASIIEVQQKLGEYVQTVSVGALPKTSDEAILHFTRETVGVLKRLRDARPLNCMKYLLPEKFGALEITKYLSQEEMTPMLEALGSVITDRYELKSSPAIDHQAAQRLMDLVVQNLGDQVELLGANGLSNSEDYRDSCNAYIRFYEIILEQESSAAANGLRFAFSPE